MSRILFVAGICLLLADAMLWRTTVSSSPVTRSSTSRSTNPNGRPSKSGELTIVDYDRPEEMSFTFCGYAGYKKLDLSNLSDQFRGQLIKSIASMKEKYPTKIVEIDHGEPTFFGAPSGIEKKETNKLRIFVYNRSFDFSQFRIGLKYNESWADTAVRLGFEGTIFATTFLFQRLRGLRSHGVWDRL